MSRIAWAIILTTIASIGIVVLIFLIGDIGIRREDMVRRIQYERRASAALTLVRNAMEVYSQKYSVFPDEAGSLVTTGQIFVNRSLSPATAPRRIVGQLPPKWSRVGDIVIKNLGNDNIDSQAIVAIAIPDADVANEMIMINWEGAIVRVFARDWLSHQEKWESQTDGITPKLFDGFGE